MATKGTDDNSNVIQPDFQKWKRPEPERGEIDVADDLTRAELDAKLGKISAETDTKIARMEGKLDLVISKLDNMATNNSETRDTIRAEGRSSREITWGVGIGVLAIIIGMLALFPSVFGLGVQVKDIAAQAAKEQVQTMQAAPATQAKKP